jgi:NAD-dependent SIR2 family protein deacetylase
MHKTKSVYILGAGFSYPAKVPVQAHLLKEVFAYAPSFTEAEYTSARDGVERFITSLLDSKDQVTLEDLFTILDRSVIAKERFRNFKWSELYDIREQLIYTILHIIERRLASIPSRAKKTYRSFAKYLIDKRLAVGRQKDELAVISSNWDTLLEFFVQEQIAVSGAKKTGLDYCIYTHSLENKAVPHTNLKALGWHNLKMLKLHGSLNWLYCSNCGRIYVDKKNIGIRKEECNYCEQVGTGSKLYLEPLIITPTILKEYNNLHIKNIWQNAFIDVQEATEVIFIGYSLPLADYEFKYLLKKAIKTGTKITAVLTKKDKKNGTAERYTNFLGNGVTFHFDGLKKWVENVM